MLLPTCLSSLSLPFSSLYFFHSTFSLFLPFLSACILLLLFSLPPPFFPLLLSTLLFHPFSPFSLLVSTCFHSLSLPFPLTSPLVSPLLCYFTLSSLFLFSPPPFSLYSSPRFSSTLPPPSLYSSPVAFLPFHGLPLLFIIPHPHLASPPWPDAASPRPPTRRSGRHEIR